MDDEDLRSADRLARLARHAVGEVNELEDDLFAAHEAITRLHAALKYEQHREGRVGTHGPDCHTWGPQHYECLLSRLSAAAERERELVEALRPFAEAAAHHIGEGESSAETFRHSQYGKNRVTVGDFRNAARALQAKEAT